MIKITNYSPQPFKGWMRFGHDGPQLNEARAVSCDGLDAIDVYVELEPGASMARGSEPLPVSGFAKRPLPMDLGRRFGAMSIGGTLLTLTELRPNGAGHDMRARGRRDDICIDFFATYYPQQPGWCQGEFLLRCSNAASPSLWDDLDDGGLEFGEIRAYWGAAIFLPLGSDNLGRGRMWDGQYRLVPCIVVWPQYCTPDDWRSIEAIREMQVCGMSDDALPAWARGIAPNGWNARAWVEQHWKRAVELIHNPNIDPMLGPTKNPGVSGSQDDWGFSFEATTCEPAAAMLHYIVACGIGHHPQFHLEYDGEIVSPERHPALRMWNSRVHWGSSIDKLGKTRELTLQDTGGWGPQDLEHLMVKRLFAGACYSGSRALREVFRHYAANYRLHLATVPSDPRGKVWRVRQLLWESLLVQSCKHLLPASDWALMKTHAHLRFERVIAPYAAAGAATGHLWDIIDNGAPEVGGGRWAQLWGQAGGAWGVWTMGEALDLAEMDLTMQFAVQAAREVVLRGYQMPELRFVPSIGISSSYATTHFDQRENWATEWAPLAIAVLRRSNNSGTSLLPLEDAVDVAAMASNPRWLDPLAFD